MTAINPKLTQEEIAERLDIIQNTAYSFACFEKWLNANLDCFGVEYKPTDEVSVALFSLDMRNFTWDKNTKTATFSAKVQISVTESPECASGMHAFFADIDKNSYANVMLMQQWVLPVEKWPCVTVELLAHCMKDVVRNGSIPSYEKDALTSLIPQHFPGFTLDRILALYTAGLLPEVDGKYSVTTLGPFLMNSRRGLDVDNPGHSLPENIATP